MEPFLPPAFLLLILYLLDSLEALPDEAPGMVTTTLAHISEDSWQRWQNFKSESCRQEPTPSSAAPADEGEYVAEQPLNSTGHAYFHWEQREFHQQLRQRILPSTAGGRFRRQLAADPSLLSRLDPRLFADQPKSLCAVKRKLRASEEQEQRRLAREEHALFEDSIIDRVFPELTENYEDE